VANTYLTVAFVQKEQVKALGARWDAAARQWYVPSGLELAPFAEWLPAAKQTAGALAPAIFTPDSGELATVVGVNLSELLAGVEKAVANAYQQGVWTRVDVVNVTTKNRHVYLELAERLEDGRVIAQARAAIWARTAERIVPQFQKESGAQLAPGIKLLVLAKPVFKAQYGFSLEISGIDASYTLGDLEAQKRRIRERLKSEGVFERNKQLPAPWDYSRVLVMAPQGAAGLGDFAAEANRLQEQRLCHFQYAHSRFQGPGAAAEILAALSAAFEQASDYDALIVIRGGGAVNDLAWLNDYDLARFICLCEVPVLTGIGHERDSTVLDEVAHRRYDTPSKVIAAIETHVAERARSAKQAYDAVVLAAAKFAERARVNSERLDTEIRTLARDTVANARREVEADMSQVRLGAVGQIHEARTVSDLRMRDVQEEARQHVRHAAQAVPAAMATVRELSVAAVRTLRADVNAQLPALLEQAAGHVGRAKRDLDGAKQLVFERAQQSVRSARADADSLMREVAGQGPKKTLARGFAVVKARDGKTVTSAKAAVEAAEMTVTFNDGVVHAAVSSDKLKEQKGDA
jgi:exodeoxyribonuclease VII large subunit